jgi:glycosyltransferase involved in cell wall biosynthesis
MPLISICIPAYKRLNYLSRLLQSISIQTFKDFEVIITDDSPDDAVEKMLENYKGQFSLIYHHNKKPKGTPANWNEGIRRANGEWIKLMHDDDWFADAMSLQVFADHTKDAGKLIFSSYTNQAVNNKVPEIVHLSKRWEKRITSEPLTLLAYNVIGPPSVTLIHREVKELYDEDMKWRVDIDYYIRLLLAGSPLCYIDKPLIHVGISETQVTNACFQNPSVELPEGYLLLKKYGSWRLGNWWVYDAWWRLLRNMEIKSVHQLQTYERSQWPLVIISMVNHLRIAPAFLIKMGVFSKIFMSISYLINQPKKS